MHLEPEIDKVEARIVRRREALVRITQETGQRATQMLASPGALAGAAVLGYLIGGGAVRRHHETTRSGRRRSDPGSRTAKRTGVIGALMTGGMWLVRAKFGSPAGLVNYLMSRRRGATSGRHGVR
jgi:hypothetical protein